MVKQFTILYEEIISVENLISAWREFLPGKRKKKDVQMFQEFLMQNILELHKDLKNLKFVHGGYKFFRISDPKPRDIHKANVRDRLLCHAIYRKLYPFFDKTFISDSYSCRLNKGTHKAMARFRKFGHEMSKNQTRTCWVLKCDIKKFFANIDHQILFDILYKYIQDENTAWLIVKVVSSFETKKRAGLPLGNLTSQLFVNIYMNQFDQYIKHKLKVKHYIRYADDFVIMLDNQQQLELLISKISDFLNFELKLTLHPKKVSVATLASGIDFLGWVHFHGHRVLRTATKWRMLKKIKAEPWDAAMLKSYSGLLKHGNTYKLQKFTI